MFFLIALELLFQEIILFFYFKSGQINVIIFVEIIIKSQSTCTNKCVQTKMA